MLQQLLEYIVRSIVNNPGDVRIVTKASRDGSRNESLQIRVNPDDLGKVIGRNGKTINAIRQLMTSINDGNTVRVDVFDGFNKRQVQLRVARIGKPVGLKGFVDLVILTDQPETRLVKGAEFETENRLLKIEQVRVENLKGENRFRVTFEGFSNRESVDKIRGEVMLINSEDYKEEEGYFIADLVGLAVFDMQKDALILEETEAFVSSKIGKVVDYISGAQDRLVIELDDSKKKVQLPFVSEFVQEVAIPEGFIVITPPPGLFEVTY